jgi:regulator of protease activity HflC (stomatin/prohibitin superfamily)
MAFRPSSSRTTISAFSDTIVSKKGSGAQVIVGLVIILIGMGAGQAIRNQSVIYISGAIGIGIIISSFLIIIRQYERAVVLRIGKYHRQSGPGIQSRIPFADSVMVVDIREKVREFNAERMLTKDNVPVTIDAILRYKVIETRSKDALLNVENFNEMIQQVSQTTLRNNIGSSLFQDVLSKREEINQHIKAIISHEAGNWGVEVTGVEIRQVIIPQELEAAMSMQAQAEREKSARITYGESEIQVAQRFVDASKIYADSPMAYALRQSNMLYESMKIQGNTIIMVPSETLNSMGFGNLAMTIGYLENVKKATTKAGIGSSSFSSDPDAEAQSK